MWPLTLCQGDQAAFCQPFVLIQDPFWLLGIGASFRLHPKHPSVLGGILLEAALLVGTLSHPELWFPPLLLLLTREIPAHHLTGITPILTPLLLKVILALWGLLQGPLMVGLVSRWVSVS